MFKIINFFPIIASLVVSSESFARPHYSHDQRIERSHLGRIQLQKRKQIKLPPLTARRRVQLGHQVVHRGRPLVLRKHVVSHHPEYAVFTHQIVTSPERFQRSLMHAHRDIEKMRKVSGTPSFSQRRSPQLVGGSYIEIDGKVMRGNNVQVIPNGNGTYTAYVDGVRTIIKKPAEVRIQKSFSNATRHGRTSSQAMTRASFTTGKGYNIPNPALDKLIAEVMGSINAR